MNVFSYPVYYLFLIVVLLSALANIIVDLKVRYKQYKLNILITIIGSILIITFGSIGANKGSFLTFISSIILPIFVYCEIKRKLAQ